jgi:hypothetical protein
MNSQWISDQEKSGKSKSKRLETIENTGCTLLYGSIQQFTAQQWHCRRRRFRFSGAPDSWR